MATSRVKGIIVEIGGDTSALEKALSKVNSSTASLSKELRGVNSLLKLDPKNTEMLSQKQKILKENIEETSKKLEQLKETQKLADEQIANGTKISDENYRALEREIANTESKLKSLKTEASNWIKAGRSIEEFGTKVTNISNKIDNLGNILTTRLTLPITAIATGLVGAAKEFETAFTGVEKTVEGTVTQMANLKQGIKDMSEKIPASTTEISAVAEAAGQLGIQTDNVLAFTKTMINMGNATNLSADEAATTLARFANVTKMSQSDFDKLGSVIVALGNNFATTEAEIADMGMNLASAGTQVGMSQSEIMALATALSSVGLEAQAGGTAFSKVMVNMQLAVEKGGDSLKDFASVAGMSANDFKKAFKEDATKAIMKFIEGLSKSGERGKSAIKVLDDMGITETRLRDALLRSANASEVMNKAVELGNKAWDENTALTNEADKRYKTLDSRLEMTKNKIKNVATSTGDKLTPAFNELLDKVDGLIDKFDGLSEEEVENILKITAFVAAIGPAIKILGTLGKGVGTVTTGIGTFSQAIAVAKNNSTSTSESVNKLASVIENLTSPAGLATVAIVALTATFVAIEKQISKNVEKAKEMKQSIEEETKARQELKAEQEKQISSNLAEIENTQSLYDELKKITDENGKIKKGYEERANFIVTQLNKALGTEIEINGNVIQSYKKIQEEIDKTILKKKAEIYLQTQEENYKTAIQNRAKAYESLVDIQDKLAEAQKKVAEAQKKIESSGGISKVLATEELRAANAEVANLGTAMEEQKELISGYTEDVSTYEKNMALMAQGTTESFNKVIENSTAKMTEQKVKLEGTLTEQISTLQESINKQKQLLGVALSNQDDANAKAYENQIKADEQQLTQLGIQLAKMTSSIETLTPEQVEKWRQIALSSKNAFNEAIKYLPDDVQKKLKEILNITENSNIPDRFGTLGNTALTSFDSNISSIDSDTNILLNTVAKHVKDNDKLQLAFQETGENGTLKFEENINTEKGKLATDDYMKGAESGINKKKGSFWDLLFGIGKKGNQRMRDGLGDGSPSVLAKQALIDYFLGADIGIKKQGSKTLDKMSDYGSMMNEEFSQNMNFPQIRDFGKLQGSLSSQIVDSTKTVFTTPQIVFNIQELDEAKLQQCFDYINRKLGSKY